MSGEYANLDEAYEDEGDDAGDPKPLRFDDCAEALRFMVAIWKDLRSGYRETYNQLKADAADDDEPWDDETWLHAWLFAERVARTLDSARKKLDLVNQTRLEHLKQLRTATGDEARILHDACEQLFGQASALQWLLNEAGDVR